MGRVDWKEQQKNEKTTGMIMNWWLCGGKKNQARRDFIWMLKEKEWLKTYLVNGCLLLEYI